MAEDKRSLLQRFIIWREKNIKEKQFILILSFLVGIFTAFAAPDTERHHTLDTELPDGQFQCDGGQLSFIWFIR